MVVDAGTDVRGDGPGRQAPRGRREDIAAVECRADRIAAEQRRLDPVDAAGARAASDSTPLSGPMKRLPPDSIRMSARVPPTPGSTTAM